MKILIIFLLLTTLQTFGATVSINLPCSTKRLSFEMKVHSSQSVGDISIQALQDNNIPFQGISQGINSILNTPTGLEALDVVSDTEMFAYGWCYSINGYEPDKFPNEVYVQETDHILWWFGFARYKDGQWISQCKPSSKRRLTQYCEKQ